MNTSIKGPEIELEVKTVSDLEFSELLSRPTTKRWTRLRQDHKLFEAEDVLRKDGRVMLKGLTNPRYQRIRRDFTNPMTGKCLVNFAKVDDQTTLVWLDKEEVVAS